MKKITSIFIAALFSAGVLFAQEDDYEGNALDGAYPRYQSADATYFAKPKKPDPQPGHGNDGNHGHDVNVPIDDYVWVLVIFAVFYGIGRMSGKKASHAS